MPSLSDLIGVQFAITSYNGQVQSQILSLKSQSQPKIAYNQNRTILYDSYSNQSLKVILQDNIFKCQAIICQFFNNQSNFYSISSINDNEVFCSIPQNLKVFTSYSLKVSYDNVTWSDAVPQAVTVTPSFKIQSISPLHMLTSLQYIEFSVLLTDVPLSIDRLKCQFSFQNSVWLAVNVTVTNNPRYFICPFYPQSYGPISDLKISMQFGAESVAIVNNGMTNQDVNLIQAPSIVQVSPQIVINTLQTQELQIQGQNFKPQFQSCLFTYQGQNFETQIQSQTATLVKCQLPNNLKIGPLNPQNRFMQVYLKIDEVNLYQLPKQIQIIPQMQITDISQNQDYILVALNQYLDQTELQIEYYCAFGTNSNVLIKGMAQSTLKNIINCTLPSQDQSLSQIRIEYYYGTQQNQATPFYSLAPSSLWTLVNNQTAPKGVLVLKQMNNQANGYQYMCVLQFFTNTYYSMVNRVKANSTRDSFGYSVSPQIIKDNLYYCVLPQFIKYDTYMGYWFNLTIVESQSGAQQVLKDSMFQITQLGQIEPQPIQRLIIDFSNPSSDITVFIATTKNITNLYCSLFQLANYGIQNKVAQVGTNLYSCSLSLDYLPSVNMRYQSYIDQRENPIDYLMVSSNLQVWNPIQEVSVRITPAPKIDSLNQTVFFETECQIPFLVQGQNLQQDFIFSIGEVQIQCLVQNDTAAVCLTPTCGELLTLVTDKNTQIFGISYMNPISSMIMPLLSSQQLISILPHAKFVPMTLQDLVIDNDLNPLSVNFITQQLDQYNLYNDSDIICQITTDEISPSFIMASVKWPLVSCELMIKQLLVIQEIEVALIYNDGSLISTKNISISIMPKLLLPFQIQPQIIICSNYIEQHLNLTFTPLIPTDILNYTLYLGTNLSQFPIALQNPSLAFVNFYAPCKKNLTLYDLQLYNQDKLPLSNFSTQLMALQRFKILSVSQLNDYLYLSVDREIEFELLIQAFDLYCTINNSSSLLSVGSNHSFSCGLSTLDTYQGFNSLEIMLQSQKLIVASFNLNSNVKLIQPSQIRLSPANLVLMRQLENKIQIKILADGNTMNLLQYIDMACQLEQGNLTPLYIDAVLNGNVITCPYTQSYLRYFQSGGNFTTSLALSINDEIIVNVTSNLSFIEPPQMTQVIPDMIFKSQEVQGLLIKVVSTEALRNIQNLQCMIRDPFNRTKMIEATVNESENIECSFSLSKDILSITGSYTVQLATSRTNYLNQSLQFQVYPALNLTSIQPSYVFKGISQNTTFTLNGGFNGLYWFYQSLGNLSRFQVVIQTDSSKTSFYQIQSVTNQSFTFTISDISNSNVPLGVQSLGIYDTIQQTFVGTSLPILSVKEQLYVNDFNPKFAFSPFAMLTITISLKQSLASIPTYCIATAQLPQIAIQLDDLTYSCYLTNYQSQSLQLAIQDQNSSQLIPITSQMSFTVLSQIQLHQVQPINVPITGGSMVTAFGSGFMNIIPFNQALICKFGTVKVTALPINQETIQCQVPRNIVKANETSFSIEMYDQSQYYFQSQSIRFFLEEPITIVNTDPTFVDISQAIQSIRVNFLNPVIERSDYSIYCQVSKNLPGLASNYGIINVQGALTNNGRSILCTIPTQSLSPLFSYQVRVSSNQGFDYSQSYAVIRTVPSLIIMNSTTVLNISLGSQINVTLSIQGLEYLYSSDDLACALSQNGSYYFYEAVQFSQNLVLCILITPNDLDPLSPASLALQVLNLNISSSNSIQVSLDDNPQLFIDEVLPTSIIHLSPQENITLQLKTYQGLDQSLNYQCVFTTDLNKKSWFIAQAVINDPETLNCTLTVPLRFNSNSVKCLNLQVRTADANPLNSQKVEIVIMPRPIIKQIMPNSIEQIVNNAITPLRVIGSYFNQSTTCYMRTSNLTEVQTVQRNDSYIECTLSQDQLSVLASSYQVQFFVTNNQGFQFSSPFNMSYNLQSDLKILEIYPAFGPYQGGTYLYVIYQNFTQLNFSDLYCSFETVNQTSLSQLNSTHSQCIVPSNDYIEAVPFSVISTDPAINVATNNVQMWFQYMTGFEFISITPEFMIVNGSADLSQMKVFVQGMNFNNSYYYQLQLASAIDLVSFTVSLDYLSMTELVFNLSQITLLKNRELLPTLLISGNDQMTQTLSQTLTILVNPTFTLVNPAPVILRQLPNNTKSYISLQGYNIWTNNSVIECLFILSNMNQNKTVVTISYVLSTFLINQKLVTSLECELPLSYIQNSQVYTTMWVSLSLNGLNLTQQEGISVIYEQTIDHTSPTIMQIGVAQNVTIIGNFFSPFINYFCVLNDPTQTDIEEAIYLNQTVLVCQVRPLQLLDGTLMNVDVTVQNTGEVIGSFVLTFELSQTVRLYQTIPYSLYQNLTYFYIDVYGDYFQTDCRCLFNDAFSNDTIWIDPTHLKCSVPSLKLKDRYPQVRTVIGYYVDLSVQCNASKSLETLSFFIKYGTMIEALSTTQIRQNEYDFFPYIYLMGQFFNPNQYCVFQAQDGTSVESPIVTFVSEELIKCEIAGIFFDNIKYSNVVIYMKEYDQDNSTIVYKSNALPIDFQPQNIIWATYNLSAAYFYLQTYNQILPLSSNIKMQPLSDYYCIFGSNDYITNATFDQTLTSCSFPFITDPNATSLEVKIVEITQYSGYSFSNSLFVNLIASPQLEAISPEFIPAFSNYTYTISIQGFNLNANRTMIQAGEFIRLPVNVTSNSTATFDAPPQLKPGLYQLNLYDVQDLNPNYRDSSIVLQVIQIPSIARLIPSSVPSTLASQSIMVQGANFTYQSQCLVNGIATTTTYVTSSLIQCQVPPGLAGEQREVRILQSGLYLNFETGFNVQYKAAPYVYEIEPRFALRTNIGYPVQVYVANMPTIVKSNQHIQYCKFGPYTVQVSSIQVNTDPSSITNFTIFTCKTPLVPSAQTVSVEILTDQGTFSSSINNDFQFLDAPIVIKTSQSIAPLYLTNLTITLSGYNFTSLYSYYCQFKKLYNFLNDTLATYVDSQTLVCQIPDGLVTVASYLTMRVVILDPITLSKFTVQGIARVLFYDPPYITSVNPSFGTINGGNTLQVYGQNLDVSFGSLQCVFGAVQVPAQLIMLGTMIECTVPPSLVSTSNSMPLYVTVDGSYWYSGKDETTVFEYEYYAPPNITSFTPNAESVWGEVPINIVGTGFIYPAEVTCRFTFSTSSTVVDVLGSVESDTQIICSAPRYLGTDSQIGISISFNNVDFYLVTSTLDYLSYLPLPRVYSIYPTYGFADQQNYNTSMIVNGTLFTGMNLSAFGNFTYNVPFNAISDSQGNLTIPKFGNISLYDNTSTYGDNRASVEVGNQIIGFSRDQIVFTYINHFTISRMSPPMVSTAGQAINITGDGFINTTTLMCMFGNLTATSVKYFNRTKIQCTTPAVSDTSIPYPISISLNGIDFENFTNSTNQTQTLLFTVPITVISITPDIAFDDQTNILVTIEATNLFNQPTLSCKIHDYITTGTYIMSSGQTYVQCVIPSFQFIEITATTPIYNDQFSIEVSNNGIDFSTTGKTFKFIIINQVIGISPSTGPQDGGTVVNIFLKDLPNDGNSSAALAVCYFPGYPGQNAVYINSTLIQCTTPPLIDNIANITSNPAYAIAEVYLDLIGIQSSTFFFVYSKNFQVLYFDPPNAYLPEGTNDTLTLQIIGVNFLPVFGELYCLLYLNPVQVVPATYINNHTLECEVPALPLGTVLPFALRIEVSQNGGIQYTNNNVQFVYRQKDIMSSLYPNQGYVDGNTYLTIGFSYFYNTSSLRAMCKFTSLDGVDQFVTRIISYTASTVNCFTPPAYLINQSIFTSGGQVLVSISSNNRDFSAQYFVYTYLPSIVISSLSPIWIVNEMTTIVDINGLNFYNSTQLALKLESSDGLRMTIISNATVVSSSLIQFDFPMNTFLNQDFVKVSVTFDSLIFFMADDRLIVYSDIVLTQAIPKYFYTSSSSITNSVYVYGSNIWDTEQSGQLLCRINATNTSAAYFISDQLVICQVPAQAASGSVEIDVTIDSVRYSLNTVSVYFINPPQITSINTTSYYYTIEEVINVELIGTDIDQNTDNGGTLFIMVDNVVNQYQVVTGQTSVIFQMPLGLDPGTYSVYVSTDGNDFVPAQGTSPFLVTVTSCPDGYFCSALAATICPPGYYCPATETMEAIKCPSGTINDQTGQSQCLDCIAGEYCPNIGMVATFQCKSGYLCQSNNTIATNQLDICPEGFYCPLNLTQINLTDVNSPGNVQACPNGYWCPAGSGTNISDAGVFNSPQLCRDGVICGQMANMSNSSSLPGAIDPLGLGYCPEGTFCEMGILQNCTTGAYCPSVGLPAPIQCPPGEFQNENSSTYCSTCPPGSFCMQNGQASPFKCRPGYTCQFEGSPYPAQLCPAGSYCVITTATNNTFSTMQVDFVPLLCDAATYCLQGVYTPIVNQSNPQAAQPCQGGTFCEKGTKDPNGGGKCKQGYYCPPNSSSMLPAAPGYYSQGQGNENQEPCPAGTYQDEWAQAACKQCPLGYQCPTTQMTLPQRCPQGTYADSLGLTQCLKCPQGTYSDSFGLTSQTQCIQCEPNYYCPSAGLTSMFQASLCVEGYYCQYGTTTNTMYQNVCPTGYYCAQGASDLYDYYLCQPGYYCPDGTSATKYTQNECLAGFYCPLGTAGQLNANATFQSGVHQLNKNILIQAIQNQITANEGYMQAFNIQQQNQTLAALNQSIIVALNKTTWTNISAAQNATYLAEYEDLLTQRDQLMWQIYRYSMNQTFNSNRVTYINTINSLVDCPQDASLPAALVAQYSLNGQNLQCPMGTTSPRTSYCLGQCTINGLNPVSVIDPVVATFNLSSLSASTRFINFNQTRRMLQQSTSSSSTDPAIFNQFSQPIVEQLQLFNLLPLGSAKILFDFTNLPSQFQYNQDFAIVILDGNGNSQTLPSYFSSLVNALMLPAFSSTVSRTSKPNLKLQCSTGSKTLSNSRSGFTSTTASSSPSYTTQRAK